MDTRDGIPLWEFIKPRRENRLPEIIKLLLIYSECHDQIDQNQEALGLFITELLYAGYDCLIFEDWLNGMITPSELLLKCKIPVQSQLFKLSKLLIAYYSENDKIQINAENLLKNFPIISRTRIFRDLHLEREGFRNRWAGLKNDPKKFIIKPLSRRDLDLSGTQSDLTPIIKKQNKRFLEQNPQLSIDNKKLINEIITGVIETTKGISQKLNNPETVSRILENLDGIIKINPLQRKPKGQAKGAFKGENEFDYKKLSKREEDKLRNEYDELTLLYKDAKKHANKGIAFYLRFCRKPFPRRIKSNRSQGSSCNICI